MSAPEFQIEWLTPRNERIAYLSDVGPFRYTKALNADGDFSLALPPSVALRDLAKDQLIRISRRAPSGVLAVDFAGPIQDFSSAQTDSGYSRSVAGPGMGWVLSGRVVAYPAGHAQANQTDQADDLMRAVVRYNLGSSATTGNGRKATASIDSTLFSVQADVGLGPSLSMGFSYSNVADVLRKISDAARTAGTPVYWELVPSGGGFEFRVNVGQLGQDLTNGQHALTFGPEFGNLRGGKLDYSARDERNYVFALGQGQEDVRNVQVSEDTSRSDASPWSLREAAVEDTRLDTDAALLDLADAEVLAGRPLWLLNAELVSTPDTQYQRDWNLGDVVNVTFDGMQFSALVRAVTVSVDGNGRETVTGSIEVIA